jgi:preprotein translocase subunit SecD
MAVMKKIKLLLIVAFLLTGGLSLQQLAAQEKTKAELEQEQKIQQAIDLQKKAILEQQKKAQADEEILKKQQSEIDNTLKKIQVEVESTGKPGDAVRIYSPRGNRNFQFNDPYIMTPGAEGFYGHGMGGDSERTTWDFSKSVKEKTFTKEYSFDVEKTTTTVVMSVMGDCKTGEIRIKIIMPGGKSYSDILIDESGNLNWRKSFTISETENQDKGGEWKFKIDSNKATGFFKISLQTY